MREILFRGKRLDNGEWVEGGSIFRLINKIGEHFFIPQFGERLIATHDDNMMNIVALENMTMYRVDSETVGQYTGLKDCKRTEEYPEGQMIFEGDVVHVLGNQQVEDWKRVDYIGLIAFLDAGFCVIDGTINDHGFRRYGLCRLDFDLEVIGNIHDNPELLKEGEGDV